MKKRMVLLLVLGMVISVTGCGGSSQSSQSQSEGLFRKMMESELTSEETQATEDAPQTESVEETPTETEEETDAEAVDPSLLQPVTVETVDDVKNAYQFDLQGAHYQLPCTLNDFLDNGCTISDGQLSYSIGGNKAADIKVHPIPGEDAYIEVTVINDSDEERTADECQEAVAVTLRGEDKNADIDFRINGGLQVKFKESFAEYLKTIYGDDETILYSSVDTDSSLYSWEFYKRVDPEISGGLYLRTLVKGRDNIEFKCGKYESDNKFLMEYWPMQ